MATKDMPHGVIGFKFAQALLSRDFQHAYGMMSHELKLEYPVAALEKHFEEMIGSAHESIELPEIEVLDNSQLGHAELDEEGWAYIAIWSEAVAVTVKPFGQDYLIMELIWGRP